MNFKDYQHQAHLTAIYPVIDKYPWMYPALGLASEAGETCGKLKKIMRDCDGYITSAKKDEIKGEIADVLWYVAELATSLNIDLNDAAASNIAKLKSRKERDVIGGSGDYR